MAYGTQYQDVVAGRVREDELTFFKENKFACASGVFQIGRAKSGAEPTISLDHLNTDEAGKARTGETAAANGEMDVYTTGANNAGKS